MRARSSAIIFGGRCRRRRRWCRESRWGLIFCARGAREGPAEKNRASSRKKNFLSREVDSRKFKVESNSLSVRAPRARVLPADFPFFIPFLLFFSSFPSGLTRKT